jgi:lipoic acid synthetase
VRVLGLKYVVITSVTRDDLTDGGASVFAETIRAVRLPGLDIKVEVLIPDFKGKPASLECILHAGPDVLSHNIETVERLYPVVRPMADYRLSLALLKRARELSAAIITKSSLMLGLGEQEKEVRAALSDLRQADCDFLTLGQYLAPSLGHYPVQDFIPPEKFRMYAELAADMGFRKVSSGPLVRSSYQAQDLHQEISYV